MYIQEAQYADDIALFSNRAEDLQDLLSAYNHVSKEMGLQINTSKTETMSIGTQVVFQVNNVKYLGSYVSRDCMMNEEIHARIQSASCAFGRLRKRVFDCRELTVKTKVNPSSTIWQRNMAPLSKTRETVKNYSTASPQVNT